MQLLLPFDTMHPAGVDGSCILALVKHEALQACLVAGVLGYSLVRTISISIMSKFSLTELVGH